MTILFEWMIQFSQLIGLLRSLVQQRPQLGIPPGTRRQWWSFVSSRLERLQLTTNAICSPGVSHIDDPDDQMI
uniref:Uncharacterized protein n=1 Tax=Arundo donax TaxID=35708 RepID=A0A0A9GHM6_ARUDO